MSMLAGILRILLCPSSNFLSRVSPCSPSTTLILLLSRLSSSNLPFSSRPSMTLISLSLKLAFLRFTRFSRLQMYCRFLLLQSSSCTMPIHCPFPPAPGRSPSTPLGDMPKPTSRMSSIVTPTALDMSDSPFRSPGRIELPSIWASRGWLSSTDDLYVRALHMGLLRRSR
jgi:hypothetical protein